MSEAVLILPNMRGGCATIDGKVHAMFRVNGRRNSPMARPLGASAPAAETVAHDDRDQAVIFGRG